MSYRRKPDAPIGDRRYAANRGARPNMDPASPHALDHGAYAAGAPRPDKMLSLEKSDSFWRTLGGSVEDPFGDEGETFRQREQARALGIGESIYAAMPRKGDPA